MSFQHSGQQDISNNETLHAHTSISDYSDNRLLTNLIRSFSSNMHTQYINPIFSPLVGPTGSIDTQWNQFNNFITSEILRSGPFNNERSPLDRRSINSVNSNQIINLSQLLQQSLLDPSQNAYKNVISDEGEKQIKLEEYNPTIHVEIFCPITQNNFIINQEVIVLPCNHVFEPHAIKRWLQEENATCPVCRYKLKSKEIKKQSAVEDISGSTASIGEVISILNDRPVLNERQRLISNLDFIDRPLRSIRRSRSFSSVFQQTFMNNIIRRQVEREEEAELQQAIMASLVEMQNSTEEIESPHTPPVATDIIDTDVVMEDLYDGDDDGDDDDDSIPNVD